MADLIYKTIQTQILLRSDTAANWESANPQLGVGEIAISTDLNQFKIGKQKDNGELASWSELSYFEGNLKDTVAALEAELEGSDSGDEPVKGLKTRVSDLETTVEGLVTTGGEANVITAITLDGEPVDPDDNKTVHLDLTNTYVNKTDYGTKVAAIDASITALQNAQAGGLVRQVVTALPAVEDALFNTIYMIKRDNELNVNGQDVYDEYIIVEIDGVKQFELLGNTELNLSGYATKNDVEVIYKKDGETESGVLVDKIEDITKENGTIDTKVAAEAELRANADTALSNRIDVIYKAGEGDAEATGLLATAQKDIDALETKVDTLEGAINSVDTKYIKTIEISEANNDVVISENGQTATIGLQAYAKDDDVKAVQDAVEAIYKKDGETETGVLVDKVKDVKDIAEANQTAITLLNNNAETEGSVAHTVATAVNAAKYITSVDESFVVSEGKLSLSETTVFILNGGSASDR